MISIVISLYNEEGNVAELHKRLKAALLKIGKPFEIIMVENGSRDRTFEILKTLSPVKIVRLRKNFLQAGGIDAGISEAKGDIVMTMDGDLQNEPEDMGILINKLDEGYDIVVGWRKDRHDSLFRRAHSRFANWLTGKITGVHLHDHACAIKAYRRDILEDGVTLYGEMHVFLPAFLALSRGAKVTEIPVRHYERTAGLSKHHLMRGVKTISDLLTVRFLSTTVRPLLFFGNSAAVAFVLGFLAVAFSIYLRFRGLYFSMTPLPVLSALFILIGLLLIMIGFLAEFMIRIYYDTRRAKPYSVKEIIEQ